MKKIIIGVVIVFLCLQFSYAKAAEIIGVGNATEVIHQYKNVPKIISVDAALDLVYQYKNVKYICLSELTYTGVDFDALSLAEGFCFKCGKAYSAILETVLTGNSDFKWKAASKGREVYCNNCPSDTWTLHEYITVGSSKCENIIINGTRWYIYKDVFKRYNGTNRVLAQIYGDLYLIIYENDKITWEDSSIPYKYPNEIENFKVERWIDCEWRKLDYKDNLGSGDTYSSKYKRVKMPRDGYVYLNENWGEDLSNYRKYYTYRESKFQLALIKQCEVEGCSLIASGKFCTSHKCYKCNEKREDGSIYCSTHKCKTCTRGKVDGSEYCTTCKNQGDYEYETNDDGTIKITGYTGAGGFVKIPSTINGKEVKEIGNLTFNNCSKVLTITIPEGVVRIGDYAFNNCDGLTSITIPKNVTQLGLNPFANCDKLVTIEFKDGNKYFRVYNNMVFDKDKTKLIAILKNYATNSITIPNSVISIEAGAFINCDKLTSITIPNSVTSIGENTFYNCDGLTSVRIPNSVTVSGMKNNVFSSCSALTDVYLPASFKGTDGNINYGFGENSNVTLHYGESAGSTAEPIIKIEKSSDYTTSSEFCFYINDYSGNQNNKITSIKVTVGNKVLELANSPTEDGVRYEDAYKTSPRYRCIYLSKNKFFPDGKINFTVDVTVSGKTESKTFSEESTKTTTDEGDTNLLQSATVSLKKSEEIKQNGKKWVEVVINSDLEIEYIGTIPQEKTQTGEIRDRREYISYFYPEQSTPDILSINFSGANNEMVSILLDADAFYKLDSNGNINGTILVKSGDKTHEVPFTVNVEEPDDGGDTETVINIAAKKDDAEEWLTVGVSTEGSHIAEIVIDTKDGGKVELHKAIGDYEDVFKVEEGNNDTNKNYRMKISRYFSGMESTKVTVKCEDGTEKTLDNIELVKKDDPAKTDDETQTVINIAAKKDDAGEWLKIGVSTEGSHIAEIVIDTKDGGKVELHKAIGDYEDVFKVEEGNNDTNKNYRMKISHYFSGMESTKVTVKCEDGTEKKLENIVLSTDDGKGKTQTVINIAAKKDDAGEWLKIGVSTEGSHIAEIVIDTKDGGKVELHKAIGDYEDVFKVEEGNNDTNKNYRMKISRYFSGMESTKVTVKCEDGTEKTLENIALIKEDDNLNKTEITITSSPANNQALATSDPRVTIEVKSTKSEIKTIKIKTDKGEPQLVGAKGNADISILKDEPTHKQYSLRVSSYWDTTNKVEINTSVTVVCKDETEKKIILHGK